MEKNELTSSTQKHMEKVTESGYFVFLAPLFMMIPLFLEFGALLFLESAERRALRALFVEESRLSILH